MESITEKIANPDPEKVELIYSDLTKTMKQSLEDGGEEFLKLLNSEKETIKVTDDDIIINGTSTRQVSNMTAIWQTQVEQYFHLLESETGDPIDETYEQISSEFPEQIIKEIVTAIDGAIRPDYKTAKKN
jgi:excinuclease UvrABC ATPase subunit